MEIYSAFDLPSRSNYLLVTLYYIYKMWMEFGFRLCVVVKLGVLEGHCCTQGTESCVGLMIESSNFYTTLLLVDSTHMFPSSVSAYDQKYACSRVSNNGRNISPRQLLGHRTTTNCHKRLRIGISSILTTRNWLLILDL